MRNIQRTDPPVPTPSLHDSQLRSKGPDRGVLLSAAELFVGRTRHDVEEQKIFAELARNLLPSTSLADRRRIATLLAGHPEIPQALAETLACDADEATAYPALRYSQTLSVDLLEEVARRGPDSLRKAVANRPALRDSVVDALCAAGGAAVVRLLLDRDDVILSPVRQASLSGRSDIVAALGPELDAREALDADGLMGQFLHLPPQLKAKAIAAAELGALVRQARMPAKSAAAQATGDRRRVVDQMIQAALGSNRSRVADLLGRGLGLPASVSALLLRDDQADGLTVAMKAFGLDRGQAASVLIRLVDGLTLPRLRDLLRLHRTLSPGAADVLVGQWQLQAEPSGQSRHLPLHQDGRDRDAEHANVPATKASHAAGAAGA